MSKVSNRIWVLAALSVWTPPALLVLAFIGRSAELLMLSFLAAIVTLFINSVLSLGLLVLWLVGVETVAHGKLIGLMLGVGVVIDVLILWLMPPLVK